MRYLYTSTNMKLISALNTENVPTDAFPAWRQLILMMAENNSNGKGKHSINDWTCAARKSTCWYLQGGIWPPPPCWICSRCGSVYHLGWAELAASTQVSAAQDVLLFFSILTFCCDSKCMAVGIPEFDEASPVSSSASAFLPLCYWRNECQKKVSSSQKPQRSPRPW